MEATSVDPITALMLWTYGPLALLGVLLLVVDVIGAVQNKGAD